MSGTYRNTTSPVSTDLRGIAGTTGASATLTVSVCLHGSSLVHLASGERKRIDQIAPGDVVLTADEQTTAKVAKVCKCWLQMPQARRPHNAIVFEPNSLGWKQPTARLVIDPGHPICRLGEYKRFGVNALRPAAKLLRDSGSGDKNIWLTYWTDKRIHGKSPAQEQLIRYDLVLEDGHRTFIANGIVVQARKSDAEAGYDHRFYPYT